MNTETLTEELIDFKEETIKENHIVLYNDDVNSFDHVINMLVKVCKHELLQAEQCAYIVHHSGKCSVKNGAYEVLEPLSIALAESGLTVEIN